MKIPTISETLQVLDRKLIGQTEAKLAMARTLFLHMNRATLDRDGVLNQSISHILLKGPTGTGKTEMAKTCAKYMDLPFLYVNAQELGRGGSWHGVSIQDMIIEKYESLYVEAKEVSGKYMIIFIDEIDKLCVENDNEKWTRSIQFTLLPYIDGLKEKIILSKKRAIDIDTTRVLFILAGAWSFIEKEDKKSTIGFKKIKEPKNLSPLHKELITKGGLVEELAGRISVITEFQKLTKPELRQAFCDLPNSLLFQYNMLLKNAGSNSKVNNDTIDKIIDYAYTIDLGARSLRIAADKYITPMFDNIDFKNNDDYTLGMTNSKNYKLGLDTEWSK